jgi:peptide/nickel transport system permease protein
MYGEEAISSEDWQKLKEYYGFDKSLPKQYVFYLRELARGNFGVSIIFKRPVVELYTQAFGKTLKLAVWVLPLSVFVGIPLGIIGALKRRSSTGRLAMACAFIGYAVPNFILAISFILVFSFVLKILPSAGDATVWHFIMPTIVLSAATIAALARYTRSSMLDVLSQDYVRTARGKGLAERIVIYKHVLRNVMIPVVTVLGLQAAHLITGSMIVETVFSWPGIGRLIIGSVFNRDYPLLQFGVIFIASLVVMINFIVDILYVLADPRIRVET